VDVDLQQRRKNGALSKHLLAIVYQLPTSRRR
jgi:hypothetical protein